MLANNKLIEKVSKGSPARRAQRFCLIIVLRARSRRDIGTHLTDVRWRYLIQRRRISHSIPAHKWRARYLAIALNGFFYDANG